MKGFKLTTREIQELRAVHRSLLNKRNAYRINVIILLGTGWTYEEVAEALLLDEGTAKNYLSRYKESGLEALMNDNYQGGVSKLTPEEIVEFELFLEDNLYQRVEDIVEYVKKKYKRTYTISGMTDLLKRMGFVYKKPKAVPGKANAEKQVEFVEFYNCVFL